MSELEGGAPACPFARDGIECPYIGAPPRVQWQRPAGLAPVQADRPLRRAGKLGRGFGETSDMRGADAPAIPPTHQHAILKVAQLGDAHGQPYTNRDQHCGQAGCSGICQHTMMEVVRRRPVPLIARQIIRLGQVRFSILRPLFAWFIAVMRRPAQRTRPELEHTVLFIAGNRLLGSDRQLGLHRRPVRKFLAVI